jgi:FkbM family methyltransferase
VRVRVTLPEDKLIWTGTWEIELSEAIRKAVQPGDVCFDVGSHRGFLAGVMAVAGAGEVHCFEPAGANIVRLDELTTLNHSLPLHVHPMALGAIDGDVEFAIMAESSMGKLTTSRFQADAVPVAITRVAAARLDTLVETRLVPVPDVIKIDVEGAELDVLSGARSVLRSAHPRLFIETHSFELARSCNELLRSLGYQVVVLETGGAIDTAGTREVSHLVAQRNRIDMVPLPQ